MKKYLNWKLGLIIIIFLAGFLRLWQLGNVPVGISDDEAGYIYNAYSIWNTGKDVLGNFLPLSFNSHSSMSPVQIYLTAPFVGIMGVSAFSGRLLSALLSIGSILFLFLLTNSLFKDKKIALLSALLFSISPWALQLQRGLWDADFAVFFMLLGMYIFVRNINTRKFLWSLISFFFAFYSYHAIKVYFVFLIPILIFFFRKELLKKKKQAILFLFGCFLIGISFLIILKTQGVTRQADVGILNDPHAPVLVNWERDRNTAPWALRVIFSNKPLYFLRVIRENYLRAFSTEYLFLSGESGNSSAIVNIYFRGEFYIIELPLLLLGIYFLLKNKEKYNTNFLFALLLIGPIASTFTIDRNFVSRNIMMLPILLVIIACGLNYLLNIVGKYRQIYKYFLLTILIVVYSFLVSSYLYQYYFRWPIYGAEAWSTSSKNLVEYVSQARSQYDNIYISKSSKTFLIQYAIFEKIDPKMIQLVWDTKPTKIYNITMLEGCINSDLNAPKTVYISSAFDCVYKLSPPAAKIVDKGESQHVIWNIYENK